MDFASFIESERPYVASQQRCREHDEVIERFGKMFRPVNVSDLTAEDFRSFLSSRENKHWSGLERLGGYLTADMNRLREAISILVDPDVLIRKRFDKLFPKAQPSFLKFFYQAVATPILAVVHPRDYGVLNSVSERALKYFGLFPSLERNASFADRYLAVNEVLQKLAKQHGLSLLELDNAFDHVPPDENGEDSGDDDLTQIGITERTLSDLIVYNWENTSIGRQYRLYQDNGGTGQEYSTRIGRIDLLAKNPDNQEWLVIELKRGHSSDVVVGQILRYMGWVQENLADAGEVVKGMVVIAGEAGDRLRYALKAVEDRISLATYTVHFNLQETQF
jgi:hypothetical protein